MAETVAPNDYRLLFSAFPNVFPSLTYQYLGFTPDLNETRDTDTLPKAENRARPRRLANSTARRDTTQDPKALAARTPVLLPEKAGHRADHSEWPRRHTRRHATQFPKALAARTPKVLPRKTQNRADFNER